MTFLGKLSFFFVNSVWLVMVIFMQRNIISLVKVHLRQYSFFLRVVFFLHFLCNSKSDRVNHYVFMRKWLQAIKLFSLSLSLSFARILLLWECAIEWGIVRVRANLHNTFGGMRCLAGALNSYLITWKFVVYLARSEHIVYSIYRIYEILMKPKLNRFVIYVRGREWKKLGKKSCERWKEGKHIHINTHISINHYEI